MEEQACHQYYLNQAAGGIDFYDPTSGGGLFNIFRRIIPFISKIAKPAVKRALPIIKRKIIPNLIKSAANSAVDVIANNKNIKESVSNRSSQFLNKTIQDTFGNNSTTPNKRRKINKKKKKKKLRTKYVI